MREAGLKYMLGQMFDQVLAKYVRPGIDATVDKALSAGTRSAKIGQLLEEARKGFVERMSANRAPMGVQPNATPADSTQDVEKNASWRFGLFSGRDLATLTPKDFMERLGNIDIGKEIKEANDKADALATKAGSLAADAADAVLKDIAQKFEALGKDAGVYFEGRARLLSVIVAIGLAFAAHVDAVDLFKTYLRDPNARAKVIEQSEENHGAV